MYSDGEEKEKQHSIPSLPLISAMGSDPNQQPLVLRDPSQATRTLLTLGNPIIHLAELLQGRDIPLGSN